MSEGFRLLTLDDVRVRLKLDSVRQVYRLPQSAGLPVFYLNRRNGRVRPADFEAWLRAYVPAPPKGHGDGSSKKREYRIWAGMRNRCHSPTSGQYRYYGGRAFACASAGLILGHSWQTWDRVPAPSIP
jgi:hypothetical protein